MTLHTKGVIHTACLIGGTLSSLIPPMSLPTVLRPRPILRTMRTATATICLIKPILSFSSLTLLIPSECLLTVLRREQENETDNMSK